MKPIKIQGKLSPDDYLQSVLINLKPLISIFSLIGLILTISFLFMLITNWESGIFLIIYVLPMLIPPAFFLAWRYLFLPRRIERILNQQKDLAAPFTMEFFEESFSYSNEYSQSKRPWADFIKWKENDQVLSIYHSDVVMTVIPKRLFSDQEHIDTIRNYLSSSIEHKKTGSRSRRIIMVVVVIMVIILTISSFVNQLP